jgi:hypothetical protein
MYRKSEPAEYNDYPRLTDKGWIVVLHPLIPKIVLYKGPQEQMKFWGEPGNRVPDTRIFREADQAVLRTSDSLLRTNYRLFNIEKGTAIYTVLVSTESHPVVEYELRFTLEDNRLKVGFQNIHEHTGYQLLDITMPAIVSVCEDQPNANLIISTHGGRRIPISECPPVEMYHMINWFNIMHLGMVYHNSAGAMLHIESLDDRLITGVRDDTYNGKRFGTLSALFTYRLQAENPELQFVVQKSSYCQVALIEDQNDDGKCDWVDGAIFWHNQLKAEVNSLYEKAFVYKIFMDIPGFKNYTTFDEALEFIKRIHQVTDGAPQIVYLVGWQHTGHDQKYPDVYTVNERLGGIERLKNLIREAKKYNAIVSFHDNYDDAYMDSPSWNEDHIARDRTGNLMKGYVWAGGQSYIIGAAYYSEHGAPERIKRTLEMYPIEKTYHIDVLSAEIGRYDFRPESPAGAQKNVEGKRRYIDIFRRYGIDVTSEGTTEPFIGYIGFAYHFWRSRIRIYPKEVRIPFVAFILHGKFLYSGLDSKYPEMDALHYGATFMTDFVKGTTDEEIADKYYLIALPASLVARLPMRQYIEDGDHRIVYYTNDTFVELDESANTYSMVFDGKLVAKDYAVWINVTPRKAYVYSRTRQEVTFPLPDEWKITSNIYVYDLIAGRPADIHIQIADEKISVRLAPGHAYRLEIVD